MNREKKYRRRELIGIDEYISGATEMKANAFHVKAILKYQSSSFY